MMLKNREINYINEENEDISEEYLSSNSSETEEDCVEHEIIEC